VNLSIEDPKYFSAVSMAADKDGAAIEVRHQEKGLFQIGWADADQIDATVKIQESVDGTGWVDISGATATLDAASGTKAIRMPRDNVVGSYVRAVFSNGTCAAGTVTVKYFFQGAR
jgi:hypothetical protein